MKTKKLLPAVCLAALVIIGLQADKASGQSGDEDDGSVEALEPAPPTTTAGSQDAPAPPNSAPLIVPPPIPEPVIEPEPAESATFAPGVPNLQNLAMAVPEVEVWRAQSESPQKPELRHRRFDMAYVIGTEPVLLRLRFHPLAAGQIVVVQPGPGVTVDPPDTEFRVEKNGECVVSIALDGSFSRSDFNVYCVGVKTKVPLSRAPLEVVEEKEAGGKGGR